MPALLVVTAVVVVLLILHKGLDRVRSIHPLVAGALFGSIGTIPTQWLLTYSLPSVPELLIKMLLSGSVWAAVAWTRIWDQRRRESRVGQPT